MAFTECIFNRRLLGADGAEAQLTRCILDYQAGTRAEVSGFDGGGLVLLNCVGLGTRIGNAGGATISNCVFTRTSAPFWQSGGSTLTNNLLVSSSLVSNMSGFIESGNILAVPLGTIFVSECDTDHQFPDDLHLQSICPGINAGTDGTDMGIYGTSSPYKDGAVPSTPHFERVDVAPATDAAGNLHVAVRVAAQADRPLTGTNIRAQRSEPVKPPSRGGFIRSADPSRQALPEDDPTRWGISLRYWNLDQRISPPNGCPMVILEHRTRTNRTCSWSQPG